MYLPLLLGFLLALATGSGDKGEVPDECSVQVMQEASICLLHGANYTDCLGAQLLDHTECYYSNHPACTDTLYWFDDGHTHHATLACYPKLSHNCRMTKLYDGDGNEHVLRRRPETGHHDRRRLLFSDPDHVKIDGTEVAELIILKDDLGCPALVDDCAYHTYITPNTWGGIYLIIFLFFILWLGSSVRFCIGFFQLNLPFTVAMFLFGLLLGSLDFAYPHLMGDLGLAIRSVDNINPHVLLGVFIPPLIFESAFATDYHIVKKSIVQALFLAGPGVLLNTGLTACLAKLWPYGWTWAQALLFGAIVSATDPVAVVALLKDLGASKKLGTLIEGESLLNDGTAFVLFVVLLLFVEAEETGDHISAGRVAKEFLCLAGVGSLLGGVSGWVLSKWEAIQWNDAPIEIASTIWACYMVFYVAEYHAQASGVLACVFMGFIMSKNKGSITPEVEHSMHHVWGMLSWIANTLIFTLAGLIIAKSCFPPTCSDGLIEFPGEYLRLLGMYVGIHVTRFITVLTFWPCMQRYGYGLDFRSLLVLVYGGLRGAIGLALAMLAHEDASLPKAYRIRVLFHVSMIVTMTLVVNATTIGFLVKKLGITRLGKYEKKILKDVFDHLQKKIDKELDVMHNNEKYSGAQWEEVTKMGRPNYKNVINEKDFEDVQSDQQKYLDATFYNAQRRICCLKPETVTRLKTVFGGPDDDLQAAADAVDTTEMGTLGGASVHDAMPGQDDDVLVELEEPEEDEKEHRDDVALLIKQMNHRLISIMKASYHKKYEEGLTSQECTRLLHEAADQAMDENCLRSQLPMIKKQFDLPKWLQLWYNSGCFMAMSTQLVYHRLSIAVEVAVQFEEAAKKALETLSGWIELGGLDEDDKTKQQKTAADRLREAKDTATGQLEELQRETHDLWVTSKHAYNDVWVEIQTRQAAARLLSIEHKNLSHMMHDGILDDSEFNRLNRELGNKRLALHKKEHFTMTLSFEPMKHAEGLLFNQKFVPPMLSPSHRQAIIECCQHLSFSPGQYVFEHGEESNIFLITHGVAKVVVNNQDIFTVLPGTIFSYDYMRGGQFQMDLKCVRTVHAFKIEGRDLDVMWRGLDKAQIREKRELLWQNAAIHLLHHFFQGHGFSDIKEITNVVHKSTIITVANQDIDTFHLPNQGFLLKGSAVIVDPHDTKNSHASSIAGAPVLLKDHHGMPFRFTIGSVVMIFPVAHNHGDADGIFGKKTNAKMAAKRHSHRLHLLRRIKRQKTATMKIEQMARGITTPAPGKRKTITLNEPGGAAPKAESDGEDMPMREQKSLSNKASHRSRPSTDAFLVSTTLTPMPSLVLSSKIMGCGAGAGKKTNLTLHSRQVHGEKKAEPKLKLPLGSASPKDESPSTSLLAGGGSKANPADYQKPDSPKQEPEREGVGEGERGARVPDAGKKPKASEEELEEMANIFDV